MIGISDYIRLHWGIFAYNFGWSNYVDWLDGRIPRFSFMVPMLGYIVLFNDALVRNLTFLELTSGFSELGLSGGARLKCVYMGLVLLGLANVIFRWRRPYVLKFSRDRNSYVEFCLKSFTLDDYIDLHGSIRGSGRDAFTRYGTYYDSEWDAFLKLALGEEYGRGGLHRNPETAHWVEAKSKYEGLLRSILIETFFRENTQTRRGWLILCISIAFVGYVFLSIPSIDLFIR